MKTNKFDSKKEWAIYLNDIVILYNSLEIVKNKIVANAKLIHGCPGIIVSKVLALEVSQMWCWSK